MTDLTLSLEGINAGYPGRTILHSLDLDLGPGLTFLVGENGAGKTTLFRLLLGMIAPSAGTIRISGQFIRSRRARRDVLRTVGYLPQDFRFPPHMRVGDFVSYMAWLRGVATADLEERARDAVRQVDLEASWRQRLGVLSGGMLRRVGVAQAIVTRPTLVLLDEPTVGLDPAARVQFRSLMADIASQEGHTVVCSTHLLEDAGMAGGTLVALHRGRTAYVGPTEELLGSQSEPAPPGMTALEGAFMRLVGDAR